MNEERSDCHLREDANGYSYCRIGKYGREQVSRATCKGCIIGKLWREYGCPYLSGAVEFMEIQRDMLGGTAKIPIPAGYYCAKTKDDIGVEGCKTCTVRDEAEVEEVFYEAKTLLQAHGLDLVVGELAEARNELYKPNRRREDNRGVVTHVGDALEETFTALLPKYQLDIPSKKTLGGLWQEFKKTKTAENRFENILFQVFGSVIDIRNKESKSHAAERTPSDVEAHFFYGLGTVIISYVVKKAIEEGKI